MYSCGQLRLTLQGIQDDPGTVVLGGSDSIHEADSESSVNPLGGGGSGGQFGRVGGHGGGRGDVRLNPLGRGRRSGRAVLEGREGGDDHTGIGHGRGRGPRGGRLGGRGGRGDDPNANQNDAADGMQGGLNVDDHDVPSDHVSEEVSGGPNDADDDVQGGPNDADDGGLNEEGHEVPNDDVSEHDTEDIPNEDGAVPHDEEEVNLYVGYEVHQQKRTCQYNLNFCYVFYLSNTFLTCQRCILILLLKQHSIVTLLDIWGFQIR